VDKDSGACAPGCRADLLRANGVSHLYRGDAERCGVHWSPLPHVGYSGALANLLTIPGDAFPKGTVASVWGFASMGSGFGGMVFSLVTGWLVDHYSFQPAFVLFGIIPLIAALLVWTLPKEAEQGGVLCNVS
jgi:hypothetical protein